MTLNAVARHYLPGEIFLLLLDSGAFCLVVQVFSHGGVRLFISLEFYCSLQSHFEDPTKSYQIIADFVYISVC